MATPTGSTTEPSKPPRRKKRHKFPVIGGRSGRPIIVPNSKVKRGYSMRRAVWSWSDEEGPPSEVPGEDARGRYVLTELAGKLVYLYEPPDPSALDPDAGVVPPQEDQPGRAWVLASVGSQRFWRGRL